MFKDFNAKLQERFNKLLADSNGRLFVTDVEPDALWEAYLNAYPEEERQGHNCNCCRQFIRNYGNVVAIVDNKLQSIWDFKAEGEYKFVPQVMSTTVLLRPIKDLFVIKFQKLGTHSNVAQLADGGTTRWYHLFHELPKQFTYRSPESEDAIRGVARSTKDVFKRGLDELTIDATETVLELIGQNSLYRGEEFKGVLSAFLLAQRQYEAVPEMLRDNYAWITSTSSVTSTLSRIRNTSIGTLLIDLSEGLPLDEAVRKFERVMAPANYKRPNAIFTKRMVEDAEKTLNELGLVSALSRRFATQDDITIDNVLFLNRDNKASDLFGSLKEDAAINPRTLSKVESISLDNFLLNVLPNSTELEVLFENRHESNLVSLIAPIDPDAGKLFKWDNHFSWSYNNALTDSMKERVKAAGGNVEGVLRFSIQWNEDGKDILDFDAHAHEPNGRHIYYGSHKGVRNATSMSGFLDVDMVNPSGIGVENITWTDLNKMGEGTYKMVIHNFNEGNNKGFSAEVEFNGEIHSFATNKKVRGYTPIAEVTLKRGQFTIKPLMDSTSAVQSKKIWCLDTNKFQKVDMVLNSPNHWDGQGVGNKHVFFMLHGAVNDGVVRGFFNEFLKQDLDKHRKVFEALASKVTVEKTDKQLSGVGFSTTQSNEFYVKVTGKFTRTLKIIV